MKIFLLIGIMILTVATVGFGTMLNSSPSVHKIGGNDNVVVTKPTIDITNIQSHVQGNSIDYTDITVKNNDSVSHTYKICMIVKAGTSISDTGGTSTDCGNTSSISSSNTGTARVNFSIQLTAANIDYSNISIQQIS